MKCRPPLKGARPERFERSLAFSYRCKCGYHFRTEAQMVSHQKAYADVE